VTIKPVIQAPAGDGVQQVPFQNFRLEMRDRTGL